MEKSYLAERKFMVGHQLHSRGIRNRRVLDAFESIPRHLFVPEEYRISAYDDCPLPIGFGQTISQPYIVAYMLQLLTLTGTERVLDIGTGSGYAAALLSTLALEVHTVELIPALAEGAAKTIISLGIKNVFVHTGDGSLGWSDAAPYDAILVSAAAPHVPKPLLDQLAGHGRMVLPIGERGYQELELWTRDGKSISREVLVSVAFVPLKGREGV
jgi:protein-L-isoaspartate(D-aspartate) O-methyltransferase